MISNKAILTFAGIAVGFYFIATMLLVPVLNLAEGTSNFATNFANTIYTSPSIKWVSNYDARHTEPDIDAKVTTNANGRPVEAIGKLNSRTKILVPYIVLLALILATPIGWKQKLIALGVSTLIFGIYIMFLFKWTVNYIKQVVGGADITQLWFGEVFNTNIGFMTILPTMIWAVTTFWAVDWNKFIETPTEAIAETPE